MVERHKSGRPRNMDRLYIAKPVYKRMRDIMPHFRKDVEVLYIHTLDLEMKPTWESVATYAIEWFVDSYAPIESTPSARLAEFQVRECTKCGHELRLKPKPHLDWGKIEKRKGDHSVLEVRSDGNSFWKEK